MIDILGVGSLNKIKNYSEFVEIIRSLVISFPTIRCHIIGEGSERAAIENSIRKNKLDGNIELRGELDYTKVMEELPMGKILLHTSTFEGQALVIMEALAAGLYVVSHPTGIAASLQSEKLFTGKTKEDLIQHLFRLLQMGYPDFSPEIHYTIEQTCSTYVSIFQSKVKM